MLTAIYNRRKNFISSSTTIIFGTITRQSAHIYCFLFSKLRSGWSGRFCCDSYLCDISSHCSYSCKLCTSCTAVIHDRKGEKDTPTQEHDNRGCGRCKAPSDVLHSVQQSLSTIFEMHIDSDSDL